MSWLVCACVLAALAAAQAAVCPDTCTCSTTRDGLHRATCSDLADFYKFTLRQKHHNINILDLSHNNITKLSHELDRLTEVVTLDLSTNGITELNKFLHNAKKLVHLNLAHNRIRSLSLTQLPAGVSSLDLTNNLLQDVPSDQGHLQYLEHLQLEGNPLDCSCENIRARDRLIQYNVIIDKVLCVSPEKYFKKSWLDLKTKDVCKVSSYPDTHLDDMMMGDEPMVDATKIDKESDALKSSALSARSVLEEGDVIRGEEQTEDDDHLFLKVGQLSTSPSPIEYIEGSGDSTAIPDSTTEIKVEENFNSKLLENDEMIPADVTGTTEPDEGSGEGSGWGSVDVIESDVTSTTPALPPIVVEPPHKFFDDGNETYPTPKSPSLYEGGSDWHLREDPTTTPEIPTEVSSEAPTTQKMTATISQKITKELGVKEADDKPSTQKTGTYICIAIIVVLLVSLIGFAIIKGQIRKRRDRRLLRQQKRDVEKASKEMVDMNKSLLGKPAIVETSVDRKANGKYELVPTHEPSQKKGENGNVTSGNKHADNNVVRNNSPRDTNQNKSSSKDHNLPENSPTPIQDSSFESDLASPDSRKDNNSLSSVDIFVPNDDESPRRNGDISQPVMNGHQNADSDFAFPREYVPVYSPDMGRVRIKLSETPKPKTPVLVTRSRSNAGDFIITPAVDGVSPKSTT